MHRRLVAFVSLSLVAASLAACERVSVALEEPKPGDAPGQPDKEKAAAKAAAPASEKSTPSGAIEKKYPPLEEGMGAVEGRVVLKGTPPVLEPPKVPTDKPELKACIEHVKNERLVLGPKNEVQNVVVALGNYRPATRPKPIEVTLDNKHCAFVPHVMAVPVGSSLKFTNSDTFIHNVQGVLDLQFNTAVPPGGTAKETARKAGYGAVNCSYHPWMQAHVHIFPHDIFDITDATGGFKLVNIPPGEHEIEIKHEWLAPFFKPRKEKVKVEAGKVTRLDIEFDAPKA